MDTSKKYIEMCEKAEEIQELKRYKGKNETVDEGDVFYSKGNMPGDYYVGPWIDEGDVWIQGSGPGNVHMDYPNTRQRGDGSRYSYDDCELVWLPRQDQLQEIVKPIHPFSKVARFYCFWFEMVMSPHEYYKPTPTMEQMWLIFLMHEKYDKTWDGEKWIRGA